LELIGAEWPEPHGASDHVGFYDASQEDGGHRLLIGREVNEDNTVGVQAAVAKPTAEVMAIEIAAVITMDDADAVDCQHGEDEALEATKRSSAVTKEHACEATLDKSLPAADGMIGGCASLSCSRANKRSSAVMKEHACEAALDKSLPAADGMVGGCASLLHSRATKRSSAVMKEHACEAALDKSLPAADGMVGGCASLSHSRATKRSSAVMKEHACEATLDKSLPAADGMVGGCASLSCSRATKRSSAVMKEHACEVTLDKSLPAAEGMVRACEADTWSQREDHIHARGATLSAALSLDMCRGTPIPIGLNTVTTIALSPPARLYCHADCEHCAAAMTSYVEASSGLSKTVILSLTFHKTLIPRLLPSSIVVPVLGVII
jgi:hypothetical protein